MILSFTLIGTNKLFFNIKTSLKTFVSADCSYRSFMMWWL